MANVLVVLAELRELEVDDIIEMAEVVVWVVVELMLEVELGEDAEDEDAEDEDGAEEDVAANGETVILVGAGWITRQAISIAYSPSPKRPSKAPFGLHGKCSQVASP